MLTFKYAIGRGGSKIGGQLQPQRHLTCPLRVEAVAGGLKLGRLQRAASIGNSDSGAAGIRKVSDVSSYISYAGNVDVWRTRSDVNDGCEQRPQSSRLHGSTRPPEHAQSLRDPDPITITSPLRQQHHGAKSKLPFARTRSGHFSSKPTMTTVTPLPARRPQSYAPAHHIGSPPTAFKNPWPSYQAGGLTTLFRTRLTTPKNFVPVPPDRAGLPKVLAPNFDSTSTPTALKATWIGHASFLVETPAAAGRERGLRILLDPVWSERVGPYGVVGPVRFTPPPCTIDELPAVDAVCISHDHYDHLDAETLRRLVVKENGALRFFCGLGVKAVLTGLGVGIAAERVTEMDWWDGMRLEREGVGSVDLVCTPAQHRSGRVPWNFGGTLWCSWVVRDSKSGGKKLFFAGDTGYCHVSSDTQFSHHDAEHPPCPAFKEIGELHGPFDLALLPIGCFMPRAALSSQHSSPEDSFAIHRDVRSKRSVGMHYGTFRGGFSMNYEPVTAPADRWKKIAKAEGLEWGEEVGLCDIGETVEV